MKIKSMLFQNKDFYSLFKNFIKNSLLALQSYTNALFSLSQMDAAIIFPVPFLRIGLSNAVMLKALSENLRFSLFLLLAVEKSVISGIFSSLIATPFFILSISQSVSSAILMFIAKKIFAQKVSAAGISVLGSAVSSVVQLSLASFYLGKGVCSILPVMLAFSVFSGLLTAQISQEIIIPKAKTDFEINDFSFSAKKYFVRFLCVALFSVFAIFGSQSLFIALFVFLSVVVFSVVKKRKVRIMPYISIAIFAFSSAIFEGNGKVLFTFFSFSVTQSALLKAFKKTLSLWAIALFPRLILQEKLPQRAKKCVFDTIKRN